MNHLKILLISALTIFLISCNKEEPIFLPKDILTSTSWQISSILLHHGGETEEVIHELEPCELDDKLFFIVDGTLKFDPGIERCFSGEPEEPVTGRWKLEDNDHTLVIDDGDEIMRMKVLQLDPNTLKIQYREEEPGEVGFVTLTFKPGIR